MRAILLFLLVLAAACNNNKPAEVKADSLTVSDSLKLEKNRQKVYSNERFKDVTVEELSTNKFLIKGKGQIFEAAFSWVVEDGHEELQEGFEMTDAGAPEWGQFEFTVEVTKKRPNSTLHIVLFETSAKDGSRQHELPILLY